jgi:hypothetical protein
VRRRDGVFQQLDVAAVAPADHNRLAVERHREIGAFDDDLRRGRRLILRTASIGCVCGEALKRKLKRPMVISSPSLSVPFLDLDAVDDRVLARRRGRGMYGPESALTISAWFVLTLLLISCSRACFREPISVTEREIGSVGLPEKWPVGVNVGGSFPAGCMESVASD